MTRILLVEDNAMNRDMLVRRLSRRGFEVLTAENGTLGLKAAHASAPDLILMDLSLPQIDGWELTRILKANPDTRAIPVIALTAHAMRGDLERALEAGCEDYDTKPIEIERLLGKIGRTLETKNMRVEMPAEGRERGSLVMAGSREFQEEE